MMKRTGFTVAAVLVFGALTMAAQTSAPVKDDLFNGTEMFAKGATDVTEVTMDPQTLGLVGGKDSSKAHRTLLNVVRTYSYDKPGMYKIEDVETFRNKLNTGDWHCSVHTRSLKTGESTDICNKQRTDDLDERAIITVSPKTLTFIHTIRKKGDYGSGVGDMPLSLLMSTGGLSSMAMLDPDSIAQMAMLKAQMGTVGAGSYGPRTLMLNIPDSAESKKLLDSAKKLQLKEKVDGDVLKELNDAAKPYGDQIMDLPNKRSEKDKPSFILAVPRAPNLQEAPAKPAPDVPQDPQ